MKDNSVYSVRNLTSFEKSVIESECIYSYKELYKFKYDKERAKLLKKCRAYALLDLYLHMRHIRYKNYLSNELNVSFTDDEIYDMASPIISKKIKYDNSHITVTTINEKDNKLLSYYMDIYDALSKKLNIKDLKTIYPSKSLKHRESEKAYIEDIILLRELRESGIDEYTEKVIKDVLGEELTINTFPKTKTYQNKKH